MNFDPVNPTVLTEANVDHVAYDPVEITFKGINTGGYVGKTTGSL
jgi:hypothetical protein